MTFFIILLVIVLPIWIVYEFVTFLNYGSPVSDADLSKSLADCECYLEGYSNNELQFEKPDRFHLPRVTKINSLIFPYRMRDIGVIPFWYESASIIKKAYDKFERLKKEEKRKKLGL